MESVPCCVCGKEGRSFLKGVRNSMAIELSLFNLVMCPECNIVWVSPRPASEELINYYPDTYWNKDNKSDADAGLGNRLQQWFIQTRLEQSLRSIKKFVACGKKIVDIGCGTGHTASVMASMGYDVSGIDVSSKAVDFARKKYDIHVDQGDFITFPYAEGSFDGVTLFGVLEHMSDPCKVLERCHAVLKPKGMMIIKIPNIDSWQYTLFRKRWSGLNPPLHLYFFSPVSLSLLLHKVGFTIQKIDHFSVREAPGLMLRSLIPYMQPLHIRKYAVASVPGMIMRLCYALGQLLFLPFVYLESVMKKGAMVTIYAEKK